METPTFNDEHEVHDGNEHGQEIINTIEYAEYVRVSFECFSAASPRHMAYCFTQKVAVGCVGKCFSPCDRNGLSTNDKKDGKK